MCNGNIDRSALIFGIGRLVDVQDFCNVALRKIVVLTHCAHMFIHGSTPHEQYALMEIPLLNFKGISIIMCVGGTFVDLYERLCRHMREEAVDEDLVRERALQAACTLLEKILAVLEQDELDDKACFARIEQIVSAFEEYLKDSMGFPGGSVVKNSVANV